MKIILDINDDILKNMLSGMVVSVFGDELSDDFYLLADNANHYLLIDDAGHKLLLQ